VNVVDVSQDLTVTMVETFDEHNDSLSKSRVNKQSADMSTIAKTEKYNDPVLNKKISKQSRVSQYSINSFIEQPGKPMANYVGRRTFTTSKSMIRI
jgi:hypothetical protein